MGFIKKNSYCIVKMLLNQFGMVVMALIILGACQAAGSQALLLAGSIYSSIFYMALLYCMTWDSGAKDRIRVDGGRDERDRLCGLKMSLCANIPNFLIVLLMVVGYLFGVLLAEQGWAQGMFAFSHLLGTLWEAMYTGLIVFFIDTSVVSSLSPLYILAYFVAILPALIASTFGYWMGYEGHRLFGGKKEKQEKA